MKIIRHELIANPSLATWGVLLEWTGNKPQVLPLVEYIVKRESDASGCFLPCCMCDAHWFDLKRGVARRIFRNLQEVAKRTRFAPYVRLGLFNHNKNVEKYARGRAPKMYRRGRVAA